MTDYIAAGSVPLTRALDEAFRAMSDKELAANGRAFAQLARETTTSLANLYAALGVECLVRLKHREEALAHLESDLREVDDLDDVPPLPTAAGDLWVVDDETGEGWRE